MKACEECGCTRVQSTYWVEVNSQKVIEMSASQGQSHHDNWCPTCKDNCNIVELEFFIAERVRKKAKDVRLFEFYQITLEDGESVNCKVVEDVRGYDDFVFKCEKELIHRLPDITNLIKIEKEDATK